MSATAQRKPELTLVAPDAPAPKARSSPPTLVLGPDETLRILSHDGRPLVEVSYGGDGPQVKLLPAGAHITVAGKLQVDAEAIELRASAGNVHIESREEVVVRGEIVRIN